MKKICNKCGGAGTLPEPKTPPVITVRIKKCSCSPEACWYSTEVGKVFAVASEGVYYRKVGEYIGLIVKTDCEPIPEIPPGYRLRRKWGKDEEQTKMGDLIWSRTTKEWRGITHEGSQRGYIFITPIKQTPDPSAECLPGYRAVEVYGHDSWMYYPTKIGQHLDLDEASGDPDFSGRYGYKREDGIVWWTMHSRAYYRDENDRALSIKPGFGGLTPIAADYVEIRKESK